MMMFLSYPIIHSTLFSPYFQQFFLKLCREFYFYDRFPASSGLQYFAFIFLL